MKLIKEDTKQRDGNIKLTEDETESQSLDVNKLNDLCVEFLDSLGYVFKKGDYYEYEITPYNDSLDDKQVKEICDKCKDVAAFEDYIDDAYNYYSEDFSEFEREFKEFLEKKGYNLDDIDGDLFEVLENNLGIHADYDYYLDEEHRAIIIVSPGDWNYDFSLNPNNSIYMPEDGSFGLDDEEVLNNASLVWLVKQQGHSVDELKSVLNGNKSDNKFMDSVADEVFNATSSLNCLVFLCKATLKQLLEFNKDCTITINRCYMCGLFDTLNGGGSVLDIDIEKPVVIPGDLVWQFSVDVTDVNYGVDDVYGLTDKAYDADIEISCAKNEALEEATTPEQRARKRGKLTTPYDTTYTLTLKNKYNYTQIQYRVDDKNKTIEKGLFNWGSGKGSFFNNRKELQRHIDDLLAQGYKIIESKDESLKESQTLTERNWRYILRNGAKLRNAIDLEDGQGIRVALLACYKELLDNNLIDEDDYNDWTEEVRDAEWEDEYGYLDDNAVNFELEQLYDLCDNIDVFVALDDDDEDISWNFSESLESDLMQEIRYCKAVLSNPNGREAADAKANYGKDYKSKVKQDLQRFEKQLNASKNKTVNEAILTPGEKFNADSKTGFYVGDICYALKDEIYDEVWGNQNGYEDGSFKEPNTGLRFAVVGTAHGDGEYSSKSGFYYPVDAGNIGIVPLELCDEEKLKDVVEDELGKIIDKSAFDLGIEADEDGTIIVYHNGRISEEVYTGWDGDDDDYWYDEENVDESLGTEDNNMSRDELMSKLDKVLDDLKSEKSILLASERPIKSDRDFAFAGTIRVVGEYLRWAHYGSSASKATVKDLEWVLTHIFNDCKHFVLCSSDNYYDRAGRYYDSEIEKRGKELNNESLTESKSGLYEGKMYQYKDLDFYLLWLDADGDLEEEYAILVDDYDDAVSDEDCIGFVSKDATDEDVMKVIADNYDNFYNSIKDDPNFRRVDESLKEDFDYVFDILVDDDYIDVSNYNNGYDFIDDIKVAREIRDKVKADYPDSKVEINKHTWDGNNHYRDGIVEDTVKQGNNWVNKGKEGTHGKFKTKKAADAQRKAMFANKKSGSTWGESLEENKDDDESKPMSLSDFINSGDFHVVLTDDARNFDIHEWEKQVEADDDSESDTIVEGATSTTHFIVSKEDVQAVLDKIANSDIFVANYYKTRGFMKANGLGVDDIKEIVRKLTIGDYSYSMSSSSFNLGDIITVFITNKNFEVNGKNLSGCVLYIEIDVDYGDPVAVVSLHSQYKGAHGPEKNPYKDESLKESKELDRQAFVSLVKLGDKSYDGYSILNDGNFVKRIHAESDDDAIKQFRDWLDKGGTRLEENVEDKIPQDKLMNLPAEEKLETPRGDFKIYQGTWKDFKNESDAEDWGFWFDHSVPENADWDDVEKWFKIMHNSKNQHAIAVLYRDLAAEKQKAKEWEASHTVKEALDTDFDNKKVRNEIVGWWSDVERWNADADYPYMIDNGDMSNLSANEVEELHAAMWDMLVALRDEQDVDGTKELLRRGKRIYNKYAMSQFNESVEDKEDKKVNCYILMDDKYNWLEERMNVEEWAKDIHSDEEAIAYFRESNPKCKWVAKMVYTYDDNNNFVEVKDDFDFFKVREDEPVEEKKETAKDRILAKKAVKESTEPQDKPEGNWEWLEESQDWYNKDEDVFHSEIIKEEIQPEENTESYVEDMEGFEQFKEELEESLEDTPIITNIFEDYNL